MDVKFETFGCGSAITSSSMSTALIKGKPVSRALPLTNKAVVEALDGLPAHKLRCSVLAEEAIKKALQDYYEKNGIKLERPLYKEKLRVRSYGIASTDTSADEYVGNDRTEQACQCTVSLTVGINDLEGIDLPFLYIVRLKLLRMTGVLKDLSIFISYYNFHNMFTSLL